MFTQGLSLFTHSHLLAAPPHPPVLSLLLCQFTRQFSNSFPTDTGQVTKMNKVDWPSGQGGAGGVREELESSRGLI